MESMTMLIDPRSPRDLTRRAVLWAAGATILGGSAYAAPAPAGAVESVRGEGYVDAPAERRWLAEAAPVFVGDLVCTGKESHIGLKLGSRTQVKLGANARLKIDRFLANAGGELVLERGALRAEHEPGDNAGLSVKSPFALLAVRGTGFFMGPSDGHFGVFVERGVVVVTGGNKTVTVTADQGTTIRWPGAQPTNPVKWGAGRVRRALASVG
jgi:hypothetical protein